MPFREQDAAGTSAVFGSGWIIDKDGLCLERDWRAYALVYLTAGSGWYHDRAGGEQAVAAGDLLVLFPGLVHSYGPAPGQAWTEVWIGFRGPVFAALESDGLLDRRRPVWHPGLDGDLIARFDRFVAAVDRAGGPSDAVLVARLHQLLVDLARAESATTPPSLVARARIELEADPRRAIDLTRLARRLGVGYDTLRRAFLAELGTTPGRWRLLRRIERAKQLLADGATLDDAAAEAGFCDRFFLARQFKAVVGQPPGAWRLGLLGRAPRAAGRRLVPGQRRGGPLKRRGGPPGPGP